MDKRLRELERRYLATGNPEDLLQLIRLGERDPEQAEEITRYVAFYLHWDSLGEDESQEDINLEEIPVTAIIAAENYIPHLEEKWGLSVDQYHRFVQRLPHDEYARSIEETEEFGYLLAMTALGAGVGLWEILPQELREYSQVPHISPMTDDHFFERLYEITGDLDQHRKIYELLYNITQPEEYARVRALGKSDQYQNSDYRRLVAMSEILSGGKIMGYPISCSNHEALYIEGLDPTVALVMGEFLVLDANADPEDVYEVDS